MNKHSTISHPKRRWRSAFTLVELLLVIAIIAILASLGVGVMAQAQNDAAIAATRSRINVIQKLLEIELEDYEVRRLPVPLSTIGAIAAATSWPQTNPEAGGGSLFAHNRNVVRRMLMADLVRAEMPDGSEASMGYFPSLTLRNYLLSQASNTTFMNNTINQINAESNRLVRRWKELNNSSMVDDYDSFSPKNPNINSAEILFFILSDIDIDGVPAIETLGTSAVADTDNDGFMEVVDGWGEPLAFQLHQEDMGGSGNIWTDSPSDTDMSAVKPVRITGIRTFITSERLFEVDGGCPLGYTGNDPVFY